MKTTPPTPTDRSERSDEELLIAYRSARDREAFSELIHRYEHPLFGYLVHYTGDRGRAEELFQATFERVIERCEQFTEGRRFRPWLYSIATHLAIDVARRARRQLELSSQTIGEEENMQERTVLDLLTDDEPLPPDRLEAEERRRLVHKAVAKLPDEYRRLVLLVYFQGLTLREAAEALELPLGTIKSRLHKALTTLHVSCGRLAETNAA